MLAVVNKNKWESTICLLHAAQFLIPADRENQIVLNRLGQFHFLIGKEVSLFTT